MQAWLDTTLGNEFKIVMGQSPASEYYNDQGRGLPFFQGKKEFGELYPTVEVWTTQATKRADKGDILLSVRAPIGDVNIAPEGCGIGRGLAAIKPNDNTCSKFILYLLKAKENDLKKRGAGVTFSAITKPNLFSLPIKVPQNKQGRDELVEAIDTQFTRLDAAIKSLKAIKAKLELYRKSVLKAAFNGKLVAITEWEDTTVGDLGEIITGTTPSKSKPEYYGREYCFFKPTDLNAGYYVKTSQDMLSARGAEQARLLPQKSILVTCIGATIGKTGFSRVEGATNQQINSIVPDQSKYVSELLYYLFISDQMQRQIIDNSSSTTLPILNKSKFSMLKVRMPRSKEEQRGIVDEIESSFSVIDKVEAAVDASIEKSEKFRKSILKSAFEGKLVN
jgi:type I restriction enzyme S subunit